MKTKKYRKLIRLLREELTVKPTQPIHHNKKTQISTNSIDIDSFYVSYIKPLDLYSCGVELPVNI